MDTRTHLLDAVNECCGPFTIRKRAAQIVILQTKIDLLQYQDTVPIPNTYTIVDSVVSCDTPNLEPNLILPCTDEPNLLERITHLPSTAIASLVDSIDVLYTYKSILSLTGEASFFNSRYEWLDPSISFHKSPTIRLFLT